MSNKSINKRVIWLIIWTTVAWVAKMASSDQWKEKIKSRKDRALDIAQWTLDFIQWWITELKKQWKWNNEK